MRTSLLSRSVVAVATLGISSAALAAVPATAAAPAGVTRDMVLTAANGLRSEPEVTQATYDLVTSLAAATCNLAPGEQIFFAFGTPTQAGDDADGLLVTAAVLGTVTFRSCEFGALAVTDPAFTLTGSSTITSTVPATQTSTAALSGDVFVTAPLGAINSFPTGSTFTASGNAARTTLVPGTKRIADRKSKAAKKGAKKKYDRRITSAKKKYVKALDKAGSSKTRKAAAKKAYSAARASAKAKYLKAIAGHRIVKTTVPTTENRPFSISAAMTDQAL